MAATVHRLVQNVPFDPAKITRLVSAYEATLLALNLSDRDDPVTLIVAQKVFEIAQTGITDPEAIARRATDALGKRGE
jgi:hypothetical protein